MKGITESNQTVYTTSDELEFTKKYEAEVHQSRVNLYEAISYNEVLTYNIGNVEFANLLQEFKKEILDFLQYR